MIERLVSFFCIFIAFQSIPIPSKPFPRRDPFWLHVGPGTRVLGNAGRAREGWMVGVGAEPSRLLALGLGKIEVILSVVQVQ
jgi:hypothetical protein